MDILCDTRSLRFPLVVCPLPLFREWIMPFPERIQRAACHRAQLHLVAAPTAAVQTLDPDRFQSGNSFFFHVCTSCFCNGFVLVLSHGVDILQQSGYTVSGAGTDSGIVCESGRLRSWYPERAVSPTEAE